MRLRRITPTARNLAFLCRIGVTMTRYSAVFKVKVALEKIRA
jgi:hypothetical protein